MEFGRRRRRRSFRTGGGRQTRAGGAGGSAGAGRAVIALLMIAAIVYLVSASAAGTWLAERVMAPAFEALSAYVGKKAPAEAEPAEDGVQQVSLSTDKNSTSANIALPALDCYALQMGVFSSEENAKKHAEAIKAQGAGGFVMADGERYRVLAAGYAGQAEAKEVKERLVNEGMDCTVHQISAPGATFKVSAQQSQIDEVESGFSALRNAQAALTETAIAFDRDSQSVADGQSAVRGVQAALTEGMAGLAAYADSAPAIARLVACRDRFTSELTSLAQSTAASQTAFSSELKYTQLSLTKAYADMVNDLLK